MNRCSQCGFESEAAFRFCPECGAQYVAAPTDPMIGRTMCGRYRVQARLGEGSMGAVYLAEHTSLRRKVAIKVLHRDLQVDEETLRRFQREGVAAGAVEHPNAIQIFDLDREADGVLFLAMEYVEGRSLEQVLADDGRLQTADAVALGEQLLDALAAAHKKGIVHRDLKPANLMVVEDDEGRRTLKVLDFGLSKLVEQQGAEASLMTRTGRVMGTPMYMSPEQWTGAAVDHRSDLYSAGLILFEMLTGKRPYEGSEISELFVKSTQGPPPSLFDTDPDLQVSDEFDEFLRTALAKSPDQRFQSASEMLEELAEIDVEEVVVRSAAKARSRRAAGSKLATRGVRGASSRGGGRRTDAGGSRAAGPGAGLAIGISCAVVALAVIGWFLVWGPGGGGDAAGGGGSEVVLLRERPTDRLDDRQREYLSLLDDVVVHVRAGEDALAMTSAEKALAMPVADAEGYLRRATVHRLRGDLDTAAGDLREALRLHPGFGEAAAGLGWIAFDRGDLDRASVAFADALSIDSACADAVAGQGAVLCARGDHAGAVAMLDPAADRFPRAPLVQLWLGEAHLAEGDAEAAVKAFVEAKRLDNRLMDAYFGLARAYRAQGADQQAEVQLRAASEAAPGDVRAHRELAALLLRSGRSREALEALEPVRGRLTDGNGLAILGAAQLAQGQAAADETLRRALDAGPSDPGRVHRLRALIALEAEAWDVAEDQSERAVGSDPGDAASWSNLGLARFRLEHYPEAAEAMQRAVDLEPDRTFTLRMLGILYKDYLNRPAEALRCFEAYVEAGGEDDRAKDWIILLGG